MSKWSDHLLRGLDTGRGYDLDDVGEGDEGGDDTSSLGVRDPSKVGGADVDPSLQSTVNSVSGLSGVLGNEGLLRIDVRKMCDETDEDTHVGELERGPTGIRVTSESRRAARDSSFNSRSLRLLEIDDLGTCPTSTMVGVITFIGDTYLQQWWRAWLCVGNARDNRAGWWSSSEERVGSYRRIACLVLEVDVAWRSVFRGFRLCLLSGWFVSENRVELA